MALVLLSSQEASTGELGTGTVKGIIGAIVDESSHIGKEEKVAMEMAIDDFTCKNNESLVLHIKDSGKEPLRAALSAIDLINERQVQAIIGPQAWGEISLVAEIGSQAQIPVLSFGEEIPPWATEKWPFLLQASPDNYAQMEAVAAIIQSWGWHRVTIIYEDIGSASTRVIPHLPAALREAGAEVSHIVPLLPFASSLSKELKSLKRRQCRVFVVQYSSLALANHLFKTAKKMKMIGKDYVWITTDTITSLIHSVNASTISSMQGILGVKRYIPETMPCYRDFYSRFHERFRLKHPEEGSYEPGIFALQAYNAAWTVAMAIREGGIGGQRLLKKILESEFSGLTGKIQFTDGKLAPMQIFQIINVVGKSYRELGFWTYNLGFSETIDESTTYNTSMKSLGQVIWPGGPWSVPEGWTRPPASDPLKIGVPTSSVFNYLLNVEYQSGNKASFSGFSMDLFKAITEDLPFYLSYDLIGFNGTYDALVDQVYLKKFDAAVGDVAITANRSQLVDFTQPYTRTGLVMIVPVHAQTSNSAWLFIKPFTKAMWISTLLITLYNSFVFWLIERNNCLELEGSILNRVGTLLWLAFQTLLPIKGEKLHSNLSRIVMVVWLFVALVITQSYTASLTTMLTVQSLQPTVDNVEVLKNNNVAVGCSGVSFIKRYLEGVIGFRHENIKNFSKPDEYAKALRRKEIGALFIEASLSKVFLARHCKGFGVAGPTYQIGGFGFAFQKGSPLLPDISKAILNLSEIGKLKEMENSLMGSQTCVEEEEWEDQHPSLSPNSFWVLFIITGGTSTLALLVYVFHGKKTQNNSLHGHRRIWETAAAMLLTHRENGRKLFSRKVSDAENHGGLAQGPVDSGPGQPEFEQPGR
ncbi:glutamate receptor 2.1-like [Malania oleifera]|uniref:glutamate receptor 2.1-like n=1 Tax=Malania oleifera TaxID=397392 RepID=UPI0025ADC847|nr:glutamate receptor 2.1-like [Malania oleifera]